MTTLAELRLANLREQKKSAEEPAAAIPEPTPPVSVHTETPVSDGPVPAAAPAVREAVREDDLILSQYLTDAVAPTVIADPEAERSVALIAHVHEMLAHKVLHPNGAKATVDMSPALFHRAKRYCLDHGNVTLRQLFLDLMTAFLDEEGY